MGIILENREQRTENKVQSAECREQRMKYEVQSTENYYHPDGLSHFSFLLSEWSLLSKWFLISPLNKKTSYNEVRF